MRVLRRAVGRLPGARWLRDAVDPERRRARAAQERAFRAFASTHPSWLRDPAALGSATARPMLLVGIGVPGTAPVEIALAKASQLSGLTPTVLSAGDEVTDRYYSWAGLPVINDEVAATPGEGRRAAEALADIHSFQDLIGFRVDGASSGRYAASTCLRAMRRGRIDPRDPTVRGRLADALARSIAASRRAERILRAQDPALVLFCDRGYTPAAELFELALKQGRDVVTWNAGHRSDLLVLKRYRQENADDHPSSLGRATWERARSAAWNPALRETVQKEFSEGYASGDWYAEVGTQFEKRMSAADALRARLGIAPGRKVAGIFPHILWDGTFFWGVDVFRDYEDWFVQTVKAAVANPRLDWVVRAHPANIVKDARDGFRGEPAELAAIRKHVGELPPHVRLIRPEDDVSTLSLLAVLDYCLTVRGTVGIEAAALGVRTLTAGTGRFDRHGFTLDASTPDEHLATLANLQDVPPMAPRERELAEAFAYALFCRRPFHARSFSLRYERDARATPVAAIRARSAEEWKTAADVRSLVSWLGDSAEDYVAPEVG